MNYKGHVQNGVIVLDEPAELREGASVTIEVTDSEPNEYASIRAERASLYGPLKGAVEMPPDWAQRSEEYLHEEINK
jgi:hypothetical protein